MTDIDIDMPNRVDALKVLKCITASRNTAQGVKPHNTGIHIQSIPVDPTTGLSSLDYKEADTRGYFKIDLINVSAYTGVRSEEHLVELMNTEPLWEMLYEKDICEKLLHVNGYHSLLSSLKPKSFEELAMLLALIRPAKKHLVDKVLMNGFDSVKDEIWKAPVTDEYWFKRAHALSYAHMIIVQLNLLCEFALIPE